jgi:hypothetical protein
LIVRILKSEAFIAGVLATLVSSGLLWLIASIACWAKEHWKW